MFGSNNNNNNTNKPFSFSMTSTPANTNTTATGQQAQANTSTFSFGSTNQQPASNTGGLGTSFSFNTGSSGATAPSASLFGSTNAAAKPAATGLFGATTNPQQIHISTGFNFGTSSAPTTTTTSNPLTTSTLPSSSSSFSFGGAAAAATTTTNQPTTTANNLFTTSSNPTSTGLSFGTTKPLAAPAPTTATPNTFSFGSTAALTSTSTAAAPPNQNIFGAQSNTTTATAAAAAPAFSLATPLNNKTTGFNFGTPTLSGSSGLTQSNQPNDGLSKSLFGTSSSNSSFGFGSNNALGGGGGATSTGGLGGGATLGLGGVTTSTAPTTTPLNTNLFGTTTNTLTAPAAISSTTTAPSAGFSGFNLNQQSQPTNFSSNLSLASSKSTLSSSASFASGTTEIKLTIPASNSLAFLNPSKPTSSVTLPSLTGLATGTSSLFGTPSNTASPAPPTTTAQPTTTTSGGLNFNTSSFSLSTKPAAETTPATTTITTTAQPAQSTLTNTPQTTTTNASTAATNDIKPTIGIFSTPKSDKTASSTLTTQQQQEQTPTSISSTTTTTAGNLPQVLSFNVPSLTPTKSDPNKSLLGGGLGTLGTSGNLNTSSQIGGTGTSGATAASTATAAAAVVIRSQLPKDQPLPQPLVECVENFKKYLEEMKKTKELNLTFNSRGLHQNIQDIITLKQKLKQSKTDLQRNFNEATSLKDQIGQELRNAEICSLLKDMPIGLQYEADIWNEYFKNRVQMFENKTRIFKSQFEQLNGYFKMHDKDTTLDSQKIIETLKITHRNLLNNAACLKLVHEEVDKLKKEYTMYRRNMIGDMSDIFGSETDENQPLSSSIIKNN